MHRAWKNCLNGRSVFRPNESKVRLSSLAHFRAHPAELLVKATPAQERPPFVKEDFHRTPHSDPPGDDQPFPNDDRQRACPMTQQLARENTRGQKSQPDDQAGPALFEKIAKLEAVQLCSIGKIIMHSGFKQTLRIAMRRKLVYMHDQ